MHIVDVAPIAKTGGKKPITYFSKTYLEPGSLVFVPIRSKESLAVVVSCYDMRAVKGDIKSAQFSLKNISGVVSESQLTTELFQASTDTAHNYATNSGAVLFSLIPKKVFELPHFPQAPISKETMLIAEQYAFQAPYDERIETYKTLIRESFARGQSLYFCVPTHASGGRLFDHLKNGIAEYVLLLAEPKNYDSFLKKITARDEAHPMVYIGTPSFSFLELPRVETTIIEHESSPHYYSLQRPYLDKRFFVERLSRLRRQTLILADVLLRYETIHRVQTQEFQELRPLSYRIVDPQKIQFFNTRKQDQDHDTLDDNKSLSLLRIGERVTKKGGHVFCLAPRMGYASLILCNDCGHVASCAVCSAPLSLQQELSPGVVRRKRTFHCRKCSATTETFDTCQSCGGVRLALLGYTVDRTAEALKEAFPDLPIISVSSKHTRTPLQIQKALDAYYALDNAVLIGTSMVLPYLRNPVDLCLLLSLDALLAHPSPDAHHDALVLISELSRNASHGTIIHYRNEPDSFANALKKGNILDYVNLEIEERKTLGYPPFSVIIRLSRVVQQSRAVQTEQYLERVFTDHDPILLSRKSARRGYVECTAIIKIPPEKWLENNSSLRSLIMSLPESYTIRVNPTSLL